MNNMTARRSSAIVENSVQTVQGVSGDFNLLDAAIDRFVAQLEYIDRRSQAPAANPDEMLILTTKAIMDMCSAADRWETANELDRTEIKEARSRLRAKTQHLFSRSFFDRARKWPQGHPGDYEMIEFLYRNTPLSTGVGHYLDRYFLATTLSVAVRERKETLRDLLAEELRRRNGLRILDIACGSCREIFELAYLIAQAAATVTCVDFDHDALDFGMQRISCAGVAVDNVSFRRYNALKMVNHERNLKEFGLQDVIYSVGFFDYLEDDLLVRLLGALYNLLSSGGKLIASFKDCRRYRTFDTSWLLDWDAFYQRTEEDMGKLLARAGVPHSALTITREQSGVIVFFTAVKL